MVWKRRLAASAAFAVLAMASSAAMAQQRDFDLREQPISQALTELASQAGVQISAPTSHLGSFNAPALQGNMDVDTAIQRLIRGTDLEIAGREGSVIVLRRIQTPSGASRDASRVEDVVVVGSRIRSTRINEALPVTVLGEEELDAIAAADGDDLFRAIPQAGDVTFNESASDDGGINNARGDVASIDLRAIGTGNTLTLLNGRRLVSHPGTQVENFVPVSTVNTNSIPTMGVRRVEVLADGAAALYGTDAVAGVVNTVLRDNFKGFTTQAGWGSDEGGMEEYTFSLQAGRDFNEGRTNISFMGDFLKRDALYVYERDYATVEGRVAAFDGRATGLDYAVHASVTPWAEAIRLSPTTWAPVTTATRVNGQTLTTSGIFHIQPDYNPGCVAPGIRQGTCWDNSSLAVVSEDNNLRHDIDTMRTMSSAVERYNLFGFLNHEFGNGIEAFGEVGYYTAKTWSQRDQESPLAYQRVLMSPTAYWNPLGVVGNGARIAGLTSGTGTAAFPTAGAPIELQDYRFADVGYREIEVTNETYRLVGGLRGIWRGFDWETGLLYSKASVEDVMDGTSMTALQAALNLTTANAYNPFVGGDLVTPKNAQFGLNDQATIDSFMVKVSRVAETELMQWDFRVSHPDIYQLPGGSVGFAGGLEARRETIAEDRDDRLDGTITFTDLAGGFSPSDVMGVSFTPDSSGARNVYSAFAELAIPVVSPDMHIPLVKSIDVQLAGRVENYTHFGSVAAPKIAVAYRPTEWLMFRTAWSEGFRAPNIMQLSQGEFERSNNRRDFAACAVQLAIGAIPTITSTNEYCASEARVESRSGNADLQPERSENFTVGAVLEPKLWSRKYGELTLTVDYWTIDQTDIVGIMGGANQLAMDYYLRQLGQTNPNVVRKEPNEQQIIDGYLAGLASVGDVAYITDQYTNLQPRTSEGLDWRLHYSLRNTPLGNFRWTLEISQRLKLYQEATESQAILLQALKDGVIKGVTVNGAEDLLRRDGRPDLRWNSTLSWNKGAWAAGLYTSYINDFYDTSALDAETGENWIVEDWLTHNLYIQYTFENGPLADTRIRVGARNIEDKDPPLADNRFGYNGAVHSNRGRWWYATLRKSF